MDAEKSLRLNCVKTDKNNEKQQQQKNTKLPNQNKVLQKPKKMFSATVILFILQSKINF